MVESLKDQTAVVTGATSPIGRAIASELASRSATLVLVGRNLPALRLIAEDFGKKAYCYRVDLSVGGDIQTLTEEIRKDLGHVDILVHNAGIISTGSLENASIEDFDVQYRVNVRAPYLLTQCLLPMLKSSQGQIVFINSSLWLSVRSGVAQYAATKYALKAIADSLRDEVNADGIRVLSVFPGRTAGPTQEARYAADGQPYQPEFLLQPVNIAAAVVSAVELPRTAEITDLRIRPFLKPIDRKD